MFNDLTVLGTVKILPEIRYGSKNQTAYTRFELHVARKGEEGCDVLPIAAFGRVAEDCERKIRLGSLVALHGKIRSREYQDKTGKTRHSLEIWADTVAVGGPVTPDPNGEQLTFAESEVASR